MNPDMFMPLNETEGQLLFSTKNSSTPIEQTFTKPQETLKFRLTQPKQTLSMTETKKLNTERAWLIELTSIEV